MALSIKDPELEKLARRQAKQYGVSITQTILDALRERDGKTEEARKKEVARKLAAVNRIVEDAKKLPGYEAARADWMKNHKTIMDAMWE